MKCPKCGGAARYEVSRKNLWKQKSHKAKEPRKDFTAKCIKCGHAFDARKVYGGVVVSKVKVKEMKKQVIKMKYTDEEKEANRQ